MDVNHDIVSRSTATVTVRLDKDVLKELHEVSRSKGASLNSTINHILNQDTAWHLFAVAAGFLYLPRLVVTDLACKLTEQEIIEIAHRYVSDDMKDAVLIIRRNFNLKETLETVRLWMESSGIPYRHEQIGASHICILSLRLGKKGSLLVGEIVASIFKQLDSGNVAYDVTENAVILRFEEK